MKECRSMAEMTGEGKGWGAESGSTIGGEKAGKYSKERNKEER